LNGPAPCVADFDGDGEPEVVIPSDSSGTGPSQRLGAYELDGEIMWIRPIVARIGGRGCFGFDFDADGAYEVLHADRDALRILDGRTGEVRFEWAQHSLSMHHPIVADVDADGSAEVLLPVTDWEDETSPGLVVLGNPNWPPAGTTWNTYDYAPGTVYPDGTVPRYPDPTWLVSNTVRARPAYEPRAVDLTVELREACATSCDPEGHVGLSVQVLNRGVTYSEPVSVALYVDRGDALELLEVRRLQERIPGISAPTGLIFEVPWTVAHGASLVVRVDDDGTGTGSQEECSEDDNALVVPPVCP